MSETNIPLITNKWKQLDSNIKSNSTIKPEDLTALHNLLAECVELGKHTTNHVDRSELQSLARNIADSIFWSSGEYPSAVISPPIETFKLSRKLHNLPTRNPFFTGREDVLNQLDDLIKSNQQVAINQALSGIGGIGKTQTALEFCHLHTNDYQTILWVNAETESSFNNSYFSIANLLNLIGSNNEALKPEYIISLVKNWLANNFNWLMVLDNLEDVNLIKNYLPLNPQGHVLVTTRSQSSKGYASIVQLKKMSPETGILFLLKRANLIPIDASNLEQLKIHNKLDDVVIADAQKIVQAMDALPLALEQAGAFIQETGSSLADYLKLYQDARNTIKILDNEGEDTNDHASVYDTFKLNFDVVKEKNVAAAKLLEVCSFLDSKLIPEEIFTSAGNFLGDELAKLQDNTYEFNNCLKLLLNYSLIERDTNNQSLSIHRLVQAVIRELTGEENKKSLVDSLAKALNSLSSDDAENPNNWPFYQKLLPSVTSLFNFTKSYQSNIIEVAYLFHTFGVYCYKQALFPQSLDFSNLALKIKKQHFGNKYPDIANTFINISSIYKTQGKYTQALDSLTQALSIKKSLYGDKHPDIALILNNMGTIYDFTGKYTKALDYYNQALSIRKHHFGDNHPDVAQTLNNIAFVYKTLGKYNDALDYIKQALFISKESFGDNHPDVADILINMGEIYREKGFYVDALDSYNQALSISKNYFDDDHLNVAEILENIAIVYQAQNKHDAALDYLKKSLSTYKKYFGEHHPSVAKALENIGNSYMHNKQYKLALDNYRQTFSIRKDFFEENHRDVAGTLNNIGAVYYYQNNFKEALSFFKQSLSIRKQLFGDNHPDIKETLNNIALVHQSQRKNDQAKLLQSGLNAVNKPLNQSNQLSNNTLTFNISTAYPLKPKK